jgi:hypothetical protein
MAAGAVVQRLKRRHVAVSGTHQVAWQLLWHVTDPSTVVPCSNGFGLIKNSDSFTFASASNNLPGKTMGVPKQPEWETCCPPCMGQHPGPVRPRAGEQSRPGGHQDVLEPPVEPPYQAIDLRVVGAVVCMCLIPNMSQRLSQMAKVNWLSWSEVIAAGMPYLVIQP